MSKVRKARLANIDIDEVSLVDKAANKRRFLFAKRDTSETAEKEREGENLELLKRFRKDKDVIKAVEGIDSHLTALKTKLEKALESDDLSDEDRDMLLAKKEEFDLMREDIEEQFEHLFLDKTEKASKAAEEDDEEADEEAEEEEEMPMMPPKGKKGKKPAFKKSEDSSDTKDEDEEESDDEETETESTTEVVEESDDSDKEDEESTDEKEVEKSDDEDKDEDDDNEELDEDEAKLLKAINETCAEVKKDNEEIKKMLTK